MLKIVLFGVLIGASPIVLPQDAKGPSLNSPDCIKVPEARAEMPGDEVLGVGRNGEYCAYPLRMMAFHRVVNDHLGGPPILVAYDPDAALGQVYDPVIEKKEFNFDSAGLKGGQPILKDRETGSIWSIATGEAIDGPLKGKIMARIPSMIITWKRFSELHPDAYVLKEDAKQSEHYVTRVTSATCPLPSSLKESMPGRPDIRLPGDSLVFGLNLGTGPVAVPIARLERGKGIVMVNGAVILYDDKGRAGAAYSPVADGQPLTFRVSNLGGTREFLDSMTRSTWSVEGIAVAGPMKGKTLPSVPSCRARWFAWSAAFPKTSIVLGK